MDRFIIRRNIERYGALLQREPDPQRRQMLERLLDEERTKLAQISGPGDVKSVDNTKRDGGGGQ